MLLNLPSKIASQLSRHLDNIVLKTLSCRSTVSRQPTGALNDLLLHIALDLVEQLTAELLKLVIEQLDHMEVIENDRGRWQVFCDGTDVGLGHVHGHCLDACPGPSQPLPERL